MQPEKQNKFKNKKVVVDGIKFSSKLEASRYAELKIMEKANLISRLELQKQFLLIPKQKHEKATCYYADFFYYDNQKQCEVAEDTKGKRTATYVIKRKLFKQKYPNIVFNEIF